MIEEDHAMSGETVTLTREEYQDLVDARDHAVAMRDVASGHMETLDAAEMEACLAATTPLAFWRRKRGMTQTALASRLGIAQPYLAQIETGKRTGDIRLYVALARILNLRIEDLAPED
jgi:DNA-binding XRE family transcriptional regulator